MYGFRSPLAPFNPSRPVEEQRKGEKKKPHTFDYNSSLEEASMGRLEPDRFLNELTSMFERNTEKGSVWVTLKHSSDKSKVQRNKMKTAGETIEFKCLIRATDGKKNISTMVGQKDHLRFQSSYATILKARMTALKKRERKDKKKAADTDKKSGTKELNQNLQT